MAQEKQGLRNRKGLIALIVVGLLAIIVIGAVVVGLVLRDGGDKDGETNPVLVDTGDGDQDTIVTVETGIGFPGEPVVGGGEPGLHIRLSPGQAQLQTVEEVSLVSGEPLSEAEIERILARLSTLPVDPAHAGEH